MDNYKFKLENISTVAGRKNLVIQFGCICPENCITDKSLVGLKGESLKKALKKPFVLISNLDLTIKYRTEDYSFTIPKGYDWNGANVPSFAWLTIGQQKEPRFRLASCVHDYICEHKNVINYDRYLSTLIFETLCEYFGRFNAFKRWAMFHSVDNWQKLNSGWMVCK